MRKGPAARPRPSASSPSTSGASYTRTGNSHERLGLPTESLPLLAHARDIGSLEDGKPTRRSDRTLGHPATAEASVSERSCLGDHTQEFQQFVVPGKDAGRVGQPGGEPDGPVAQRLARSPSQRFHLGRGWRIGPVAQHAEAQRAVAHQKRCVQEQAARIHGVKELTHGEGAEATLECTARPQVRVQTIDSAKLFGRACFVGEGGSMTLENVSQQVIHKHLAIYGSWTFTTWMLEEAANWIIDRNVPINDLITHRFSLEQAKEAWRDAKEKLAQARKAYEQNIEALTQMITQKSNTPLFDEEDEAGE